MEPHLSPDTSDTPGQDTGSVPASTNQSAVSSEGAMVAELWRALEEEGRAKVAAKDETISRLDAEVAFLREQLDQRNRELAAEQERFNVIQRLALQRIKALTATVAEQREDAPPVVLEAKGATEGVPEGDPSWLTAAWRKVRGI